VTKKNRTGSRGLVPITYGVLALATVGALGPSVWILISSFKTTNQTLSGVSLLWPQPFSGQGYVDAMTQVNLFNYVANSAIYAVGGTLGALSAAFLAAYPLTRFRFAGRNAIVAIFTLALAVPVVGLATPEFFVVRQIGLFDTKLGMVIFYAALLFPLSFVIMRSFLASLPGEMEEAAVIDGASYFRIVRSIVLPLARPAIATVAVVSFVNIWNEFFFANLLTASAQNQTVQLMLASFRSQFTFNVSATLAGTMIIMLVPIALFFVMQKQVIAGLTAGAVK
jgi:raffinose/stachyose/melibiose transport system permease protein